MSASARGVRTRREFAGSRVPTAAPARAAGAVQPSDSDSTAIPDRWWGPEALKGWAGSVSLHALFLVLLACWFFPPRTDNPIAFDSRLAGSPNGVIGAESLTGGFNTPLPMPPPLKEYELSPNADPLKDMKMLLLEPDLRNRQNTKPSAAGGADNDNPGAGDGDGFGLARFGEGGELIRGVSVKVGDPQFTLIWNTDGVDLDLHVIEPGGKEIYWEEPKGALGGELDVDNTKGFGPENIYWLVDSDGPDSEKVKGPGPPGTYKWFVVYWGGFGGLARPTHWQVRVKHAGTVKVYHGKFQALNERSKVFTLTVEAPSKPGSG
jgi:hypothetical protein